MSEYLEFEEWDRNYACDLACVSRAKKFFGLHLVYDLMSEIGHGLVEYVASFWIALNSTPL